MQSVRYSMYQNMFATDAEVAISKDVTFLNKLTS
jgi:hypothetical protein